MKIVIGLGNPGSRYKDTRHNIGFMALDRLAGRLDAEFSQEKYGGLVARSARAGEPLLLVKPLTFMNNSGDCVARVVRYTETDLGDMLVVADDVNLPLGRLRFREGGSAGGHNGLKSIIAHLGDEFSRLRVGVGRGGDQRNLADHVLSRFEKDEVAEVARMTTRAADAAEMFIASGIEAVMNAFNGGDPATTE